MKGMFFVNEEDRTFNQESRFWHAELLSQMKAITVYFIVLDPPYGCWTPLYIFLEVEPNTQ